jgi:2-oxoglutarate ferredoxin oxidoreductase subunit alpha
MAPGSVESCFNLTLKSFHLAERLQSPCFIMTDQYLADSYRAVEPQQLQPAKPVKAGDDPKAIQGEYQRYQLNESGISPRLLPGASKHLVLADSDEHTEDGHITEDLEVRVKMVEKRLKKIVALKEEFLPPIHTGMDDPDLLLVCWGSSQGPVEEAAEQLNKEGRKTATLCFEQVWPLEPNKFMPLFGRAAKVVCVEGNATGQFAALLKRETGFSVDRKILRYDGRPFTVDYILAKLQPEQTKGKHD